MAEINRNPHGTHPNPRPRLTRRRSRARTRQVRALARDILATPMDYVHADEFTAPGACTRLFDDAMEVRRADVTWYRPLMDPSTSGTRDDAPSRQRESIVLTREEEGVIFRQYNYARYRVRRMQESIRTTNPGVRQAEELVHWFAVAQRLRDQIAEANLALVLAMSKRIRLGDMDYGDLVSEGNMALLRSIDKFDVGRGFKFSTYACRAILKAFSRHGMKHARYRSRFPIGFDPALEKSNHVEELRVEQQRDAAEEVKHMVLQNAADLSDVEREVLHHRFGIGPGESAGLRHARPRTLAQVGKLVGLTKERVRQIQNKALAKLRMALTETSLPLAEQEAFARRWRESLN